MGDKSGAGLCNDRLLPGAIHKYFAEHEETISAHNARHGLTAGHNNWHDRRGVKITNVISTD